MADFLADFTRNHQTTLDWWSLYVDGVSNVKGNRAGIILEGPDNVTLEQTLKFNFKASNNQAMYEVFIARLKLAREVGAKKLQCYTDSQLVQGQVVNGYQTKEIVLLKYYHIAKTLIDNFKCFKMYYIPRESNTRANLLSNLANTKKTRHFRTIIQKTLQTPTIDTKVMAGEEKELDWMTPYNNFLILGVLPLDKNEARRLK
ncbi:hypothetical protein JHK82_019510 [Glycine max]|uniref:RNase H type-1 domain-containing protein n=1 Tax=Glycine max TaxID=3847 RepID=A0A0R0JF85_SOYBN|nr:hypothetical protein JHK85_019949 [Glycine max]KAG5038685.1 hypothetical protein JHK86_019525 [Glycine max]KAG5143815.1 hypothetical protein JHK82_019510 [Glycine max]